MYGSTHSSATTLQSDEIFYKPSQKTLALSKIIILNFGSQLSAHVPINTVARECSKRHFRLVKKSMCRWWRCWLSTKTTIAPKWNPLGRAVETPSSLLTALFQNQSARSSSIIQSVALHCFSFCFRIHYLASAHLVELCLFLESSVKVRRRCCRAVTLFLFSCLHLFLRRLLTGYVYTWFSAATAAMFAAECRPFFSFAFQVSLRFLTGSAESCRPKGALRFGPWLI